MSVCPPPGRVRMEVKQEGAEGGVLAARGVARKPTRVHYLRNCTAFSLHLTLALPTWDSPSPEASLTHGCNQGVTFQEEIDLGAIEIVLDQLAYGCALVDVSQGPDGKNSGCGALLLPPSIRPPDLRRDVNQFRKYEFRFCGCVTGTLWHTCVHQGAP